jgi:GTP-binding protein
VPKPGAKDAETNHRILALMRRNHSFSHLEFSKAFFGQSHSVPKSVNAPAEKGRPRILYSAGGFYDHPPNEIVPEIVILGCSNAGKSTLINAILDCKLARASDKPGYTKTVNAYGCGPPIELTPEQRDAVAKMPPRIRSQQQEAMRHSLILLDTPGFGHKSREGWGAHIESILFKRRQLKGAIVLLRGDLEDKVPDPNDKQMLWILASANIPVQVVLTRADRNKEWWPSSAWKIASKVRTTLGERGVWGTDNRGRGLWDGGVWITAAGINRSDFQPSRDRDNAGVRGVRAALLDIAGYRRGRKPTPEEDTLIPKAVGDTVAAAPDVALANQEEEIAEEDDEIVPFDQIPIKPRRQPAVSHRRPRR